jgi:hypothetical protein
MSKEYSEKNRFLSIYGSGYITAPQYLTEQLCAQVARSTQEDLIDRFWKLPKWTKFFKEQIPAAFTLLKKYDVEAILKALKDKRAYKVYSFRAPWFIKIVQQYQTQIDLIEAHPKQQTVVSKDVENNQPRQQFGQETLISKLK